MGRSLELRQRNHAGELDATNFGAERKIMRPKLLTVSEIPSWYQNNDYIVAGYRPVSGSLVVCLKSLSYLHNETANIFSHLIPAVSAVVAQAYLWNAFWVRFPNASYRDYLIFEFHALTSVCCFGLSAAYHTVINHSEGVLDMWSGIDYVGILSMILGDFVSGIYVEFYCEPHLQRAYWAMILVFGASTATLVLHLSYQHRRYRLIRLATFVATGLSAFAPIVHAIKLFDLEKLNKQSGLPYYYAEGALCIVGAFFYATNIPERLAPGSFDIWIHSHMIFHCFVVVAAAVHFRGIWIALEWNYDSRRCPR